MLVKNQYEAVTGRNAEKGHLFFQIRQAFLPGEISVEEAQKIGYETAMRWTKGKYQFFVCTHNDKGHLHNHIYYNATAEDSTCKFHNFIGSSFHVRRLSDRVCLEHNLSIIINPKQHSKGQFMHYGEWLGGEKPPTFQERLKAAIDNTLHEKPEDFDAFLAAMTAAGFEHKWGRGGALSFRAPDYGQERFTRLRSSTLGDSYGIEDIRDVIEGRAPLPERRTAPTVPRKVNLIIDIQEKMKQGKGAAYAKWATVPAAETLTDEELTLKIDQSKGFNFQIGDIDKAQQTPKIMGAAMSDAAYRPPTRCTPVLSIIERITQSI